MVTNNLLKLTEELNQQQKEAVEKPINTFVKIVAGAGTGKTKIISKRYVKLIQDLLNQNIENPLEHLLVITFTEKAAAEMKERIIKELQKNNISHHGQENWISTIHGFCSKLLRKHAIEANLSPDFELADEVKQQEIYQNIVQKIKNNEIENIEFIEDIADELGIDISVLNNESLLELTSINDLDNIFDNIFAIIKQIKSMGLQSHKFLEKSQDTIEDFSSAVKDLQFGISTKEEYIASWESQLKNYQDEFCNFDEDIFKSLSSVILDKHNSRKAENWTCCEKFYENIEDSTELELLLTQIIALIYANYQKHLEASNLVDYDDLINKTLFILENNEVICAYYKKYFKHIIVDEFQDTNTAQMRLLLNLLSDEAPNITIVGDRKQSIYAFRHAKMENLDITQKAIEKKFHKTYEPIKLINNYRSTSQVLTTVNYITENQMNLDENLISQKEIGDEKDVKFSVIQNCNFADEYKTSEAKYIAKEILEAQKLHNLEFKDFAILVNSHSQCDILEEELLKYGILCVKKVNSNYFEKAVIKNVIAMFNLVQNIRNEYAFVRILKIKFSDKEIYDFKKEIDKNFDDLKLNFAEKVLELIEKDEFLINKENQEIFEYSKHVFNTIFHILENKKTFSLTSIYHYLTENIKPYYNLSQIDSQSADIDLSIFEKITFDYALNQKYLSLKNFVEYIELISEDKNFELPQVDNEEINAVHLLTIHASKGLEFPYVFVANIKKSKNTSDSICFELNYSEDKNFGIIVKNINGQESPNYRVFKTIYKTPKNDGEDLRLFYVALSRAQKYLNVLINENKNTWYVKDIQEAFENQTICLDKNDIEIEKKEITSIKVKNKEQNIITAKIEQTKENIKNLSVSFSKINTFNHCNQKFLLKYIYKYPELCQNQNSTFKGSIIHNLIYNSYLNKKLFTDNEIKTYLKNTEIEDDDLTKIINLYSQFKQSNYTKLNFDNVLTEYNFNFSYNDTSFTGDIDLLYKNDNDTYNIIDFKTNENIEKSLLDYTKQMYIYNLAIKNQGFKIKNLILVNLKTDETKEFILNDEELKNAQLALDKDIENIKNAYNQKIEFQKNTKNYANCANCGYKYFCKIEKE